MVERVARAICKRRTPYFGGLNVDSQWRDYVADARAAIEAMREPSARMVRAGRDGAPYDRDAAEVWPDMIDEALK